MKSRRRAFLTLAATTTLGLSMFMPRLSQVVAQFSPTNGRFSVSPTSGVAGSQIFASSIDPCPTGSAFVQVTLSDPGGFGQIATSGDVPVSAGASWSTTLTVPTTATAGRATVTARCLSSARLNIFDYVSQTFDVTFTGGGGFGGGGGFFNTGRFSLFPPSGAAGTVFSAQSLDRCVPPPSAVNPRAVVFFTGPGVTRTSTSAFVDRSGNWGPVQLTVPFDTPPGQYNVFATCFPDTFGDPFYDDRRFVDPTFTDPRFSDPRFTDPRFSTSPAGLGGYFNYLANPFAVTGNFGPGPGGGGLLTQSAGSVSPSTVTPGQQVTIAGEGFAPNADLSAVFTSAPVSLGSLRADGAGRYAATVTIPPSATPGTHTITVSGPSAQLNSLHQTTATVLVTGATGGGGGGRIPFTGAAVRTMTIVATALVLGGLLLLSGREVLSHRRG